MACLYLVFPFPSFLLNNNQVFSMASLWWAFYFHLPMMNGTGRLIVWHCHKRVRGQLWDPLLPSCCPHQHPCFSAGHVQGNECTLTEKERLTTVKDINLGIPFVLVYRNAQHGNLIIFFIDESSHLHMNRLFLQNQSG